MKWCLAALLLMLSTKEILSQSIQLELGPIVDQKAIEKEVELPEVGPTSPFRSFSYTAMLFCDPAQKRVYSGFGFQNKAFYFGVVDNYLKYSGLKRLASETINEEVQLNAFIPLNNKLYVLYSVKNPKQDEFTTYVNEVSSDLVVLGSPIVVQNFKELKSYGMNVSVSSSEDRKHLFITRLFDSKSKESLKLECKMIDNAFAEVWFKRIETEIVGKENSMHSVKVDAAGNLYALMEYQNGRAPKPIVYAYFWQSKTLKTFEPGLSNGETFGTKLEILKGNEPWLIGLSEDQKKKEVSYFISRINTQSLALENVGSAAMPADFRKASNANIFDMRQWSVMDIITTDNDAIVASIEALLVEAKYGVQHSYNAFVFAFRKDGSPIWSRTIQKKQTTMPGMAGHILIPAKNNVLFLYNDDSANLSKTPDDASVGMFNSNNAVAVVQEIDPSGKVLKYPLTKNVEFEGFALNFNAMGKIEKGFYFDSAIKINSKSQIDTRNATLRVTQ